MSADFTFNVKYDNEVAEISLSGQLSAANVTEFSDEMKSLVGKPIKRLVFYTQDLEYIASAGLRVIIFLKQKIGEQAEIYFIGGQEAVVEVLEMSGLDNFLRIQDSYEG